MNFEKLVPNIFYADITVGLKLFVDCLDFTIGHDELKSRKPFCVLEKDGLRINLFEDAELAKEHNPEFRLVTKNIEEVYKKVAISHPEFLHPNLKEITLRPWGAKEFALTDKQLGIVIQQW
jgi:predicted HAD superfamily hydrolase